MTNNTKNRGSVWRKWDLHAHTPLDHEWINRPQLTTDEEKQKFAKEYISFAESQGLSVIGITDHNFCNHSNDLLLEQIQVEAAKKSITILPGFEITASDGSGIHMLVLFPENTPVAIIKSVVDSCFPVGTTLIPKDGTIPVSNKSIKDIHKIIHDSNTEAIFIFAHADRDNGVLDPSTITGTRRVQEWQNEMVGIAQISKKPSEYTSGFMSNVINKNDNNYTRDIAYIVASDCRSIDEQITQDERHYLGEKFTWIKADPTFEGLKQIIYEPEERVRIQEDNPEYEFGKPSFSEIKIKNDVKLYEDSSLSFSETTLPLNKNLVAIIGGRGTGKSRLIDYWANIFQKYKKEDSSYLENEDFLVSYHKDNSLTPDIEEYKGNQENFLDFIYISQEKLKDVTKKENIGNSVKKLLNIENESFSKSLELEINELLKNLSDLKEWSDYLDEDGDAINSKKWVNNFKNENEQLLKSVETRENKEKLNKYVDNIGKVKEIEGKVELMNALKKQLEGVEKINEQIKEANKQIPSNDSFTKLEVIDFNSQKTSIENNISHFSVQKKKIEDANLTIKKEFEDSGYKGDLESLLKNANNYKTNIEFAETQLKEIKVNEDKITKKIEERGKIADKLKTEYEQQRQNIDDKWESILDQHGSNKDLIKDILLKDDSIGVTGKIYFDKALFYQKLFNIVDGRTYREESLETEFGISNFNDWINFIKNKLSLYIEGDKTDGIRKNLSDLFFNTYERGQYLKVIPEVTYQGKNLDIVSVGQRGTAYLCLQLATGAFSQPIIFDQPEDDLDNEFIMDSLIDIFRKLKKYRQIIIVTHNANLVVNADAEQVVVANNIEEKLSYVSGSLEEEFIIKEVCKILEGGQLAFEQRKKKYSL